MSQNYTITKTKVLRQIYDAQKTMSKSRNMPLPEYTFNTLRCIYVSDKKFCEIFDKWVASNYDSKLKPSIDRINPLKAYRMDNIQIMTWGENEKKGNDELCIVRGRSVEILDENNISVAIFRSIKEASLITGINQIVIERSCKTKYLAGGYKWKYVGKCRGHKLDL